MLSPPRLPASGGAFNADAWKGSCRASAGAARCGKFRILDAKPCSIGMHGYFS